MWDVGCGMAQATAEKTEPLEGPRLKPSFGAHPCKGQLADLHRAELATNLLEHIANHLAARIVLSQNSDDL